MRGIGNDIIALASVDAARTQAPRFHSKILADSELQLYRLHFGHFPFHYFVWLLWSVKESAYKCLQRHQPTLVFSPVTTVVTQIEPPVLPTTSLPDVLTSIGFNDEACFKITITFQNQVLYSRSIIYGDELIHTVASFDNDCFSDVNWGIKKIGQNHPDSQSAAVRLFLLNELKLRYPGKDLSMEKNAHGWPLVLINGAELDQPLSFSHHEGWVGYAFC